MNKDFFVMLYTQVGDYVEMTDDEGDVAKYHTMEEARAAALNSVYGETFGYEIFEIGTGEQ